ncbi:hypothetical protein [Deinococcus maricopensis]|uniref:hypothetical protein n=1 Tax=Deinococcus maricopensis TaxID=309887 RepID=UPI00069495DC|nr:hypothetical protein [Deinococcus maricopensis]
MGQHARRRPPRRRPHRRPPPRGTLPLWLAHGVARLEERRAARTGATPQLTRATLATVTSNQRVSHARAARELGYAPRPLNDMIRDTVAWFDQAGLLQPPTAQDALTAVSGT